MQIPCPSCGEQLPITSELLGTKIRCGGCQMVVDIPPQLDHQERDDAESPDDNSPSMLVDCVCGNRSRVPTSSAGSEVRCPSCQQLMRIPRPSPRDPTFVSGGAFPTSLPVPASGTKPPTSVTQAPIDHPYPVQHRQSNRDKNEYTAIYITAVLCFFGLVLVIGAGMLVEDVSEPPPTTQVEVVPEKESNPNTTRVEFQEGYSMQIPVGCKQESRQEMEQGPVVYRFRRGHEFAVTVAIIQDETIDRFSRPPKQLRKAYVKGVPELVLDVAADVQPKQITINGMRAVMFRFYERETYRGVKFTYFMVALDQGNKLVLNFHGRYGDQEADDENIQWPHLWYESLLTLRSNSYVEDTN